MIINIVERLFPGHLVQEQELERWIEHELLSRMKDLIKRIQDNKIDPIGLGIYARAYQYEHYEKVKEHWGEALAESNIDISLDVDINSIGATE